MLNGCRFKSLRTPFYRGSDCCLLTFDVNDSQSFENMSMWKQEFLHYADVRDPDKFSFVLIGNKVDLGSRVVKREAAEDWCAVELIYMYVCVTLARCAKNGGMPYFETSAKDNINVEKGHSPIQHPSLTCDRRVLRRHRSCLQRSR